MPKTFCYNQASLEGKRQFLRKNPTSHELKLWSALGRRQICQTKFLRQYSVGSYILDFYSPEIRLAIELDGSQHLESEKMDYDERRTAYLEYKNIHVVRFYNSDIESNYHGVLEHIVEVVEKLKGSNPPQSPLVPRGEE